MTSLLFRAFLTLVAGALCGIHAATAATVTPRPNVVVILADDMGYGDLGCYGHPLIETPNIDALARRGVRLTSFYAAPSCVPARTQLMLGKYPARVDFGGGTGAGGKGGIADDETTLAEAVKAAGYDTAMVGKWHLGSAEDRFLPVRQGFDSWLGLPYSNDMVKPWVQTDEPLWLYDGTHRVEHPVKHETLLARYTQRATEFIRKPHANPFFLYFAPAMVHLPLAAGAQFRGRSRAGLYGDAVQEVDWAVGEVVAALRAAGKENDTVVVFASDNGPWINPPARMLQAGNLPWHVGSAGALRGAKGSTYEGGVRVPAIFHWPGHFEGGRTSAEMASLLDVYATVVRLATGAAPKHAVDGYDLTAFLEGKTKESPRKEFFYFGGRQPANAVRSGPWKLRTNDGVELYHLDLDPSERYNRAAEMPDVVAELKKRLEQIAAELGRGRAR